MGEYFYRATKKRGNKRGGEIFLEGNMFLFGFFSLTCTQNEGSQLF